MGIAVATMALCLCESSGGRPVPALRAIDQPEVVMPIASSCRPRRANPIARRKCRFASAKRP